MKQNYTKKYIITMIKTSTIIIITITIIIIIVSYSFAFRGSQSSQRLSIHWNAEHQSHMCCVSLYDYVHEHVLL